MTVNELRKTNNHKEKKKQTHLLNPSLFTLKDADKTQLKITENCISPFAALF